MVLKWFDGVKKRPRIIGFCGFARAGKNTAAEYLRKIISDVFGLNNLNDIYSIGFADMLKFHLEYLVDRCKDTGCDITTPDFKEKFRPMYVEWSRVYKNITGNNEIWCDLAFKKIAGLQKFQLFMITDVRYDYEIERIRNNNGVVIYIDRPGFDPANDEEEKSFAEIYDRYEDSFDGNGDELYVVKNDGTKLDLGVKCFETLRQKGII